MIYIYYVNTIYRTSHPFGNVGVDMALEQTIKPEAK